MNAVKRKARSRAYVALRSGLLVRQPCRDCGGAASEMHHPDYSAPLAVVWLCRSCHWAEHRRLGGGSPVDDVIDKLGGTAKAAEIIGVTSAAVSNWRRRKQIPSDKYLHINQALTRLGSAASPDVFGFHAPEQRASA